MHITLFQPRYPHGKSQCYLPGGLMNLGSRLLNAGVEVSFFDLNFSNLDSREVTKQLATSDLIGFSVLGHPYIPEAIENLKTLRKQHSLQDILVGGEGIARLQEADFQQWFGELDNVFQIKNDDDLRARLWNNPVVSAFKTSMAPMLTRLSEPMRRVYLTSEFALFISNGCKFGCAFCEAAKGIPEQYRTRDSLRAEVEYICVYLKSIGHPRLEVYLSNLDAFQNPKELEPRVAIVGETCRKYGITSHIRCLATSRCTVQAIRADPELPQRLHAHGLRIVAFGADGADEETWKREKKTHNKLAEIHEAVITMQNADILVELLMVIGFQQDKPKALWHDVKFSFREAYRGAVIRPYLGKSRTPSAPDRWESGQKEVEACRKDPNLLLSLDFAMIASKVSHPSCKERWLSTLAYLLIIGVLAPFGLCPTRPLVPIPQKGIGKWLAQTVNRFMPFDR